MRFSFVTVLHWKRSADLAQVYVRIAFSTRKPLRYLAIRVVNVFAPEHKDYFVDRIVRREKLPRGFQRDLRGFVNRITVSAATDRRKRYRFDFLLHRKLQGIPVAICQRLRFSIFPAAPDRSHRVNDELRQQSVPASNLRFSGFATAKFAAFGKQVGSRTTVDRAIHSASAEKRTVCRVHDCSHLQLCDIAADDFNFSRPY